MEYYDATRHIASTSAIFVLVDLSVSPVSDDKRYSSLLNTRGGNFHLRAQSLEQVQPSSKFQSFLTYVNRLYLQSLRRITLLPAKEFWMS